MSAQIVHVTTYVYFKNTTLATLNTFKRIYSFFYVNIFTMALFLKTEQLL